MNIDEINGDKVKYRIKTSNINNIGFEAFGQEIVKFRLTFLYENHVSFLSFATFFLELDCKLVKMSHTQTNSSRR